MIPEAEKRRATGRRLHAAAVAALALGATASAPNGAHWTRLSAPAGVDRAAALALDVAGQRLAVGGERGVAWGPLSGPLERVLSRGPVRDLAFTPDGALLAATDAGLYRIVPPGRVVVEGIAPGEAAREVRDLDVVAARAVVATAAGVYLRRVADGPGDWRRVAGLPGGPASSVALLPDPRGGVSVWAVFEGALWSARSGGSGRRVSLPDAAVGEEGVRSLARGGDGALYAVLARSLAVRDAAGVWRTERLVLPPGATPLRLSVEPGCLWLATDAGLLLASSTAGPWRRAGPPAGHISVSAVAGAGARLVVATAHGLLRHARGAAAASGAQAPILTGPVALPADPTVASVQRRALRYLDLDPERMRRLWRAAARSGLYPDLSVRGDYGRDRDRGRDYDQVFVSGDTRHLFDEDHSRGEGYGVSVELRWELGAAAYNPEHVDVSREARLVAQLRDDVLDEITQLYYERQRVLATLAAPSPDASPAALRLRAAELASGLDAWTGGWFSEQLARGPASPKQESSP